MVRGVEGLMMKQPVGEEDCPVLKETYQEGTLGNLIVCDRVSTRSDPGTHYATVCTYRILGGFKFGLFRYLYSTVTCLWL